MVLLIPKKSSLADRQALIGITLRTSSPTLSLGASEDPTRPFQLLLDFRILASTQPGRPITLCTTDSVFETKAITGFDVLALGRFIRLTCILDPQKTISLASGFAPPNMRYQIPSPNLRDWDWVNWITIPADGVMTIAHNMPLSRIFKYETNLTHEAILPGEQYRIRMYPGHVGTTWWCWGDLGEDLKEKKFSQWIKDEYISGIEEPTPDALSSGEWIVSEPLNELWIEDEGDGATFKFTE